MAFERRLTYKIYSENGTFIESIDDVIGDLTIKKQINGGDSEFSLVLDRKMDDFDEGSSIAFNNRVKIYLKDSYNPAGDKLIANGYIVSYKPFLQGKDEGVEITCLSAVSKLSNDFYRIGTALAASELGVELIEYTTGTAVFTNGSATVTGTNTNWLTSFKNRSISNDVDGTLYEIDNVVSSTSITLSNVYTGSTTTSDPYTIENPRVDEMMQAIINHYRTTETNSMISNDFSNIVSTTDNDGNSIRFKHKFFNMKHIDALREAAKFLPRSKDNGYWYYWRISTDGNLYVKNISSTPDHTFHISRHITEISGRKSIEDMTNRVYFWNEKGASDPNFIKLTSDDTTSQDSYDIISEYITDSKITDSIAANLLTQSRVFDKKDPKVRIEVTLNGEYDLSSINPGDTCKILNVKNNPFKIGSDDILVIHSIEYGVDSAKLTLADASDRFEDMVESERQRLDKEMTWYGFITQVLTAAQLGPANRSWSTNILFSATADSDAYRKVKWGTGIPTNGDIAGTVYVPSGASGEEAKRVIDSGNTGNMSPSTNYFIYLDEETISTLAATSDSGTGIIREGDDALTDLSKAWTNDQYKGYIVTIGEQTKIIKSNTTTVLTIEDRWTISNQTSAYTIKPMTFETSSSSSAISSLTKVVFSNVRAHTSTSSEAIITTTQGAGPTDNFNIGGEQIAKKSISKDEIEAKTITAGEIAAGTITADEISAGTITTSKLNFTPLLSSGGTGAVIATINASAEGITIDADNLTINSTTTFTSGWEGASNVGTLAAKDQASATDLDVTVISGGKIITGLLTADNIQAGTLTGRTVRTSSGTTRVEMTASTNELNHYVSGVKRTALTSNGLDFYNTAGSFSATISALADSSLSILSSAGVITLDGSTIWLSGSDKISGTINGGTNLGATGTGFNNLYLAGGTNTGIYAGSSIRFEFFSTGDKTYSKHLSSYSAGTYNLGDASFYWNDISYKTLTDRGCLGWFDMGVELQDGRIVSDIQSIKEIKKHPTLKTVYGAPRLDYKTMPKAVYRKALDNDGNILPRDKNDKPYSMGRDGKTPTPAEDGAETTALLSIMLGALKELDKRIEALESKF